MFASVTGYSAAADMTFAIPLGIFAASLVFGFFARRRLGSRR